MTEGVFNKMVMKMITLNKNNMDYNPFKNQIKSGIMMTNIINDLNDVLNFVLISYNVSAEDKRYLDVSERVFGIVREQIKIEVSEENYEFAYILSNAYKKWVEQVNDYIDETWEGYDK
jgi:hypothetical protein